MKPHGLLHLVTGAGLGLLLVGLFPTLGTSPFMWGVILVAAGFAGEFLWLKK